MGLEGGSGEEGEGTSTAIAPWLTAVTVARARPASTVATKATTATPPSAGR
ncbi:hypothetical protein ACWGLO_18210 [Streptomyces niveus]